MKQTKKWAAALLAMSMMLSLTGCADKWSDKDADDLIGLITAPADKHIVEQMAHDYMTLLYNGDFDAYAAAMTDWDYEFFYKVYECCAKESGYASVEEYVEAWSEYYDSFENMVFLDLELNYSDYIEGLQELTYSIGTAEMLTEEEFLESIAWYEELGMEIHAEEYARVPFEFSYEGQPIESLEPTEFIFAKIDGEWIMVNDNTFIYWVSNMLYPMYPTY